MVHTKGVADYMAEHRAKVAKINITKPEDVETLPWGGNAALDCPIMARVDLYAQDERYPKEDRAKAVERAGFLMTGEDCSFTPDHTFDDYLKFLREEA